MPAPVDAAPVAPPEAQLVLRSPLPAGTFLLSPWPVPVGGLTPAEQIALVAEVADLVAAGATVAGVLAWMKSMSAVLTRQAIPGRR